MIFTNEAGQTATGITWTAPTTRTDGTSYGDADHAGYELGTGQGDPPIFTAHVSVPATYGITEWPLDQLNLNTEGAHEIALRTVDKGGRTSGWSAPVTFIVAVASPDIPTGLSVY